MALSTFWTGVVQAFTLLFSNPWAIQFEAHVRGHPLMNALASELANRSSEHAQVDALMRVYAANQSMGL